MTVPGILAPMRTITIAVQLLIITALSIACSGSSGLYKKGQKLDEAGLHYEASNFYIDALQRKSSNSDAILALKVTGQKVLDDYYAVFYQYYSDKNLKKAVYAYLEADNFKSEVTSVGVKLMSADYYEDYYKEVKTLYIHELYETAQKELDNEKFADAELKLKEIQKLEPTFRDVTELTTFAYVEPKYRMAIRAFDKSEYRKAYFLFEEIIKASGNYKESEELKDIAQENARYTIGILKFENSTNVAGMESALSGSIVRDLMNLNDPFLIVIDRTNTQKLISEQKLGMTGIIDEGTAAKAGEMLGAKAILVGKVVSAEKKSGRLMKQSKTGYLGKPVKKVNPETGQKYSDMIYSKVYYYDYKQENTVSCTFQYQLISSETGEILISDMIEKSVKDKIYYSTFTGDSKYLYQGTWTSKTKKTANDKIYNSRSAKREIDNRLRSSHDIRSTESLANDLFKTISKDVSVKIKNYNPEG
jgi:hypothetical protein